MRFFVTADVELYEQVRAALDAAWGLPNSNGTVTCISPAAGVRVGEIVLIAAPRDAAGRVLLAVLDEWCEWPPADEMLPQLLASGAVEEISEADYWALLPGAP
jgi:hypothetical protein